MIEHVRRRALLADDVSDVFVATCDQEIANVISSYGGQVIMTSNTHTNGTSRVAEAVEKIGGCSHVILLQGDEPLLLPRHLTVLAQAIEAEPEGDAWNATGPIESQDELDRHSFVKCAVARSGRILFCFRRTPFYCDLEKQRTIVRKILGIIAYRKDFLLRLTRLPAGLIEQAELIEQMRIIENGYNMTSVPVEPSLPSVNEPEEVEEVLDYLRQNEEQYHLLQRIAGSGT